MQNVKLNKDIEMPLLGVTADCFSDSKCLKRTPG